MPIYFTRCALTPPQHRKRAPALSADVAQQHEAVERVVCDALDALSGPEIARQVARRLTYPLADRTIRKRLAELTAAGRIRRVGDRRGRRYYPIIDERRYAPLPRQARELIREPEADIVPLSSAAERARARITRPRQQRTPVGYEREFLSRYEPGTTWYLPAGVRAKLHRAGATPESGRPAGTFARDILARLLIDLSWASSRLEGNTYSRLDTQNLIEFGQIAEGKDASEAQMILNHKSAIELLVEEAATIDYDRRTLFTLHAVLSQNLLSDTRDEGRLRTRAVGIGGSTFVPLAMPQQIEEYFTLILNKARAIPDAFERSFFAMVHLPYLQPFIDVNKRTSRMAANISLVKENLCPLSFIDVPSASYIEAMLAIYEDQDIALLRDVYVWAYERSCSHYRIVRDSFGEPDIFRLRYRLQLQAVVRAMIADMHAPARSTLRAWAESHQVPAEDVARFADLALELLMGLSEGAAARDRITAAEYGAWRARFAKEERG